MGQSSTLCTRKAVWDRDRSHLSYNKWTKNEIKLLERMFRQMAKRSPDPESMSKETFLSVYQLPGFMSERLFKVFDWKKSGDIDFEEFILGLEKFFRSSLQDKARVIFKMYDLNDNGCVDIKELSTMLHSLIPAPQNQEKLSPELQEELSASEHHRLFIRKKVETAFRECDLNHDGKLSLFQFNLFLSRNPDIVQMMEETFSEHAFLGNLDPAPPASTLRSRSEPATPQPNGRLKTYWSPDNLQEEELRKSTSNKDLKSYLFPRWSNSALMSGENLGLQNLNSSCSPVSSRVSDLDNEDPIMFPKIMINKATCFSCKIVFTFHDNPAENLVSLETDPDYSVFNLRNVAGITTSINLKSCVQCGGDLRPSIDQYTEEGESSISQIDTNLTREKGDPVSRTVASANLHRESWNPNRIIMQGILSKRGRTTKTWMDRWYVLKDKFLYHYKIAKHREGTSGEPISVEFIRGCTCEIEERESEKQSDKFCFTLTYPEGNVKSL